MTQPAKIHDDLDTSDNGPAYPLRCRSVQDLFGDLRRLYHHRVTTMGPCPVCGGPSRSGEICHNCILAELKYRGAELHSVMALDIFRAQMKDAAASIESTENQIANQIEKRKDGV